MVDRWPGDHILSAPKPPPHGWIILDKPLGLGSTQGVAAVKRNLRAAGYGKVKVGHGGTLDPLATGVLPIALGEATKLAGRMLDADKIYDFCVSFGDVTIHGLEVLASDADSATLRASVSKGTYIRSLARDIALALGTRGSVTMLRRLKAGPFTLQQAISLDKLNEIGNGAQLEPYLLPLEAGLDDIPALNLGPEQAGALRQGRVLSGLPQSDGLYWARLGITPIALVMVSDGSARVERGFNIPDVAE